MYGIPLGTTRSVLLVEEKDKDGNVVIVAHHLRLMSTSYDIDLNVFYGERGRVSIEAIHMGGGVWSGSMPEQDEVISQKAIETNEEIVIEGELIEDEIEYEWAFWDSDPNGLGRIIQSVYGVPLTSYDQAKHAGDKSVYGQTVVGRRRKGSSDEWEIVTE